MTSADVSAQSTESNVRWKGNNYQTLLSQGPTEVFLYNVGTGRFLNLGGDWGTQARLFYEDTGKILTLQYGQNGSNVIFETGMSTQGASVLGCNVSEVTSNNASDVHWNQGNEVYTVLLDGAERVGYKYNGTPGDDNMFAKGQYRNWNFIEVEGEEDGVITYYMYEDFGSQQTEYNKENKGSGTTGTADYTHVWLGANYGENWNSFDGDPNGPLVLLSRSLDKVTWSTVDPRSTDKWTCGVKSVTVEGVPEGTTSVERTMQDEVPSYNADTKVKISDFYKWRIVTKEEVLASMTSHDIGDGLSTNLTYMIQDRGFERNDWNFFTYWSANQFSDITYQTSGYGRYKYTWGLYGANYNASDHSYSAVMHWTNNYDRTVRNESYMKPIRLKSMWDSKKNAAYGFMEFEGVGTVSTSVTVPQTGKYKVSAYGFYQGSHEGYLFATTKNPADDFETGDILNKQAFKQVSGLAKGTSDGVMEAGKIFVANNDDPESINKKNEYLAEVEIDLVAGQTVYFGVGKNAATRVSGSSSYYYDSDWVGVDQFQLVYLGTDEPIIFNEIEPNWNYLPESSTTEEGRNRDRNIRLHRTFTKGQWNSFVFPYDLTAVQVRRAFGQSVRLAELVGLGIYSKDAYTIDFRAVELPAEGAAVTKNKFYLIKPLNDPIGTGDNSYFDMGAHKYLKENLPEQLEEVTYPIGEEAKAKVPGHNIIKSKATYFNNTTIPKHAYIMSGGKMYYLGGEKNTKGFRGWIEDVPVSQGAKFAIDGVFDEGEISGLEEIFGTDVMPNLGEESAVYDLSGRKIADSANQLETLSKGMYIVNGKKFIVK